jgi:hypothetical protein
LYNIATTACGCGFELFFVHAKMRRYCTGYVAVVFGVWVILLFLQTYWGGLFLHEVRNSLVDGGDCEL